jgi:hypothetical protein
LAVTCFDADPVNSTLASFSGLQVTKVDLIETTEKGRRINPRRFDDLVEKIASQPAQSHLIVDTGARRLFLWSTTWLAMTWPMC